MLQLAADTRTATARLRRHTALQNSTCSHSRADLRLNLMGSPQTLHVFTAGLPRFKVTTLLFISNIKDCPFPGSVNVVSLPFDI
jgi:hypothetical protein